MQDFSFSINEGQETSKHGRVFTVNDLRESIDVYRENGLQNYKGVSTGWPSLDECYKIAKGTLNIITGIPGHGKSEFVDALMVNTATAHDWRWFVYSPENYPFERGARNKLIFFPCLPRGAGFPCKGGAGF